ncbi:DUF1836 domain-containing protein [Metabacillus niabensis]|uniref:DUF1836 domain-containing protein n=1 Tax=Metabacillus niabensis TaxID=324854 RepID=A0ABT9YV80_9BACI|nr:DUF1836 domain-containing protein [Metabacillus niabensis]MDQ0223695.1 hypothetical protein [Metabacillus niabensis]PAD67906.1 hypothetical protein CHH83_16585 [Bacillus sp. 7586-K]
MSLQLTRKQMTTLLYALKGESNHQPSYIIEKVIGENPQHAIIIPPFLTRSKRRTGHEIGLSSNDIVALANLCELTSLKSTSIQNWIKRDVKELIGPPELGKKYSIEQTAMLLIVKDLKNVFDFERIRKLLTVVFNTLSDRSDDLINPIAFYEMYADVIDSFHTIPTIPDQSLELTITNQVDSYSTQFSNLTGEQWKPIRHVLVITVFAVLASHFQSRAYSFADLHFN